MFDSVKYWKQRYESGGNSGNGSYGLLCEFKNQVLNDFVKNENIKSVVEIGCGDGNQLIKSNYPKYFGYDISEKAIKICKKTVNKPNYFFNVITENTIYENAELSLSLDVLFHLVEDKIYTEYLNNLFRVSTKWVIIYACDMEQEEFIKNNKNKKLAPWMRLRKFTKYISDNFKNWELNQIIKNKYGYNFGKCNNANTSISDFYIYKKIN